MVVKTFPYFKWLAIISVALLVFMAGTNGAARADAPNQDPAIVAQNETQTPKSDTNAPSSQGKESDTQTDENKESTDAKEAPVKAFQPSERIEAEQAVDFPYDI